MSVVPLTYHACSDFYKSLPLDQNQCQGCKISQFETLTIKNPQFETLTKSKFPIQWDPGPVFKMPEKSLKDLLLFIFTPGQKCGNVSI